MKIVISDLEKISRVLFEYLKERGIEQIEIDWDYYWHIPTENRYDMSADPSKFEVGQLSEDWHWLQKYLSGKSKPISYGLVWLSTLLRAVGEKKID